MLKLRGWARGGQSARCCAEWPKRPDCPNRRRVGIAGACVAVAPACNQPGTALVEPAVLSAALNLFRDRAGVHGVDGLIARWNRRQQSSSSVSQIIVDGAAS